MKNFQFSIFNLQIIILALLLSPTIALATEFAVEVDVGRESINALEGRLNVPSYLEVENIYLGNSAILFWIEEPTYDADTKAITFSGITPGGFSGRQTIFILQGHFDEADAAKISFSNIRALKNDGSGSPAYVQPSISRTELSRDQEPPDEFNIKVSSSPELFLGKEFIIFATQDKGTGISRYEYASTWLLSPKEGNWRVAESPLELTSKMKFQRVYIRAIDEAGNMRTASIPGPYWYLALASSVIILLCGLLLIRRTFSSLFSRSS